MEDETPVPQGPDKDITDASTHGTHLWIYVKCHGGLYVLLCSIFHICTTRTHAIAFCLSDRLSDSRVTFAKMHCTVHNFLSLPQSSPYWYWEGQVNPRILSCEVNPRDRYTILFHIVYLDSSLGWEWNEVVGPKMNSMSLHVIWSFHSGEGDGDGSVLGSPMPFHCLSFLPEWNISSHHIISGALKKVGQFQSLACQIKRGSWCTVPWWPWCNLASWFKRGYSHRRYILGTRNAILGLCRWLTLTNHVWPSQSHKLEYLLIPWPVGLTFSSIFFWAVHSKSLSAMLSSISRVSRSEMTAIWWMVWTAATFLAIWTRLEIKLHAEMPDELTRKFRDAAASRSDSAFFLSAETPLAASHKLRD